MIGGYLAIVDYDLFIIGLPGDKITRACDPLQQLFVISPQVHRGKFSFGPTESFFKGPEQGKGVPAIMNYLIHGWNGFGDEILNIQGFETLGSFE